MSTKPPTVTDLNQAKDFGIYRFEAAAGNDPPSVYSGVLLVSSLKMGDTLLITKTLVTGNGERRFVRIPGQLGPDEEYFRTEEHGAQVRKFAVSDGNLNFGNWTPYWTPLFGDNYEAAQEFERLAAKAGMSTDRLEAIVKAVKLFEEAQR